MSMYLTAAAFKLEVGNGLRKLVLLKLADNANDNGECFPSIKHIAKECEMGRTTVKSHIKALEELGYQPRPIAETIEDTVAWWKQNRERTSSVLRGKA